MQFFIYLVLKEEHMKNLFVTGLFMSTLSMNVFAVQDQLKSAEQFLSIKENTLIEQTQGFKNQDISLGLENKSISVEGEHKYVEINSDIRVGQKNNAIGLLQKQLDLDITNIYDTSLQEIIKEGQNQWGLSPTGIIDENTWFAFYKQPLSWQKRIAQEAIAEWTNILTKHAESESPLMIVVNFPSQTLMVYERKGEVYNYIMSSPVVIGSKGHQSPFDDISITSLKYNPNWTPTPSMIKRNLYKGGELNTKWVSSHGLVAIDEDGDSVDLEDISEDMKLRFVQPSGDGNALGLLKFETNSRNNIYLHDTNEKNIFNFNTRVYSSGCIRVKEYLNLASIISSNSSKQIKSKINQKQTVFEKVNKTPVYFSYAQVMYDVNGNPMYYADVYKKRNHHKKIWN